MVDVLIVEDVGLQRLLLRQFLGSDHAVIGADAHETVALAQKHRPDVIVDTNRPDVDGLTAARRINRRSPETKIVASTALVDEEAQR